MNSFLLECLEMLDEARRDPNLKGMGNLNSLDSGLKKLLLTKVDQYYKFKYNDPKRSTLQAGFGTGSQLKALPGVSAATTPYKMLDAFKATNEIKALIIEIGGHQVALIFKQKDKNGIVTFSFGISQKVREMAAKDVSEADVMKHAEAKKAEEKKYTESNKHYYTDEEHAERLKKLEDPKEHTKRLISSREQLEAAALEKLTKKSFKTGRNTIGGWELSRGSVGEQSKQKTSEWVSHLIEFVRAELGDKEAEVKYIGITADPEREKLHKEREEARKGTVPRDEENLYIKKALKKGELEAIEKKYNIPAAYSKYTEQLKKALKSRADALRVARANDAAITIDSASDLHKLIASGKFHEKFKLMIAGRPVVYNFYDERNLRYNKLIAQQKGEKIWESDMPYIEFRVGGRDEEGYEARKEFRDKAREIEAKVEAGELTKEEGEHRVEMIERELIEKSPPSKIMLYLRLHGYGLVVDEIGLVPAGSWSTNRRDMVMYKVMYDDKGEVKGLELMSKAEAARA